nr:hypothetical protein [uncultured Mediterranean phage uvMED]
MELFNNSYLPDRLDLLDPNTKNSIAYVEFIEAQKRANNIDFLNKAIKLFFTKG